MFPPLSLPPSFYLSICLSISRAHVFFLPANRIEQKVRSVVRSDTNVSRRAVRGGQYATEGWRTGNACLAVDRPFPLPALRCLFSALLWYIHTYIYIYITGDKASNLRVANTHMENRKHRAPADTRYCTMLHWSNKRWYKVLVDNDRFSFETFSRWAIPKLVTRIDSNGANANRSSSVSSSRDHGRS